MRGQKLRLRAGHRRLTATRLAGRKRIPAIIHGEALEEGEWLIHAVQENVMRRDLDLQEKVDTIRAMSEQGMTREGIAEAFGVTRATITAWEKRARGEVTTQNEHGGQTRARVRRERVAELTAQGHSASEIADMLDLSPCSVTRARTGTRNTVGRPALRELIAVLRTQVEAGASAEDIVDALETFTETLTVPEPGDRAREEDQALQQAA